MIHKTTIALIGAALLTTGANAGVALPSGLGSQIDLNQFANGEILNGFNVGPVIIDGDNFHNSEDYIVAFDTTLTGTRDSDLEGPNGNGGSWDVGNLRNSTTPIGNILIIQEVDRNFDGYTDSSETVVSRPDDEGRRSGGSQTGAGEITFDFTTEIDSFGFTLIDVEETGEFNRETGFFAVFSDGSATTKVSFEDLIEEGNAFFQADIVFGDNSANRIDAFTAAELGLASIESVTINLGGSGGVGDLTYNEVTGVPSPTAAIAGIGLMGVLLSRRGNRRQDRSKA